MDVNIENLSIHVYIQQSNNVIVKNNENNILQVSMNKSVKKLSSSEQKLRIRKSSSVSNKHCLKPNDKIYKALGNLNLAKKHWNQFLLAELDLKSTISEFQNVDFNSSSKNKKELLRQGYQLKREIIQYINNEKYDIIKQKLEILATMSINQKEKEMIQTFKSLLQLKQLILGYENSNPCQSLYRKQTYKILKENAKKWSLIQNKNNSVAVKIFSIMALHFVKISGIIMKEQQHGLCNKALELKKKHFMVLQDQQTKKKTLQSLLFMTFEYYKIIRLLKKDQHQILFYYNHIVTCINIFKTKFKGFDAFQRNFNIQGQIEKIQPLYLNVDIYEDSRRRRILSYQNTQDQMLNNRKSLPSRILIPLRLKTKTQLSNSLITKQYRNSLMIQRRDSRFESLIQNDVAAQAAEQAISIKQQAQNLINPETFDAQLFAFDFYFIHSNKFITGSFKVHFNQIQSCKLNVDISLKLKQQYFYLFIYQIRGLAIPIEELKYSFLSKNIWKAIKYILSVQEQVFIKIPGFQNYAMEYIPKNINQKEELPALTQIYQTILMKFRRTKMSYQMIGNSLNIQKISVCEIANFMNDLFQKQEKQIFKKRLGFINQEMQPVTLQNEQIKRLIFIDYQKEFNYIQLIFNGEDLKQVLFTQKNYSINSKKFIEEMKSISKLKYRKKGRKFPKYLISLANQKILNLLYQTRYANQSVGNIELELEVMNKQNLLTCEDFIFKDHWINKKKYIRSKQKNNSCVPIRLANKLQMLYKKQYKYCQKYFNQKVELIVDKRTRNSKAVQGVQIKPIRLQMYKTIVNIRKISNATHCWRLFLSRNDQNAQPKKLHQQINLEILQHKVIKVRKNYYVLLQYYFYRNQSYIYQVILAQEARKFVVNFGERIYEIKFDPINFTLNGKVLEQIKKRGKLSDINCFIEQKISKNKLIRKQMTL